MMLPCGLYSRSECGIKAGWPIQHGENEPEFEELHNQYRKAKKELQATISRSKTEHFKRFKRKEESKVNAHYIIGIILPTTSTSIEPTQYSGRLQRFPG